MRTGSSLQRPGWKVAMTAPPGRSGVGWAACVWHRPALARVCSYGEGGSEIESEDGERRQGGEVLCEAGAGAVGFNEGTGWCVQVPAGLVVGAVDEAGDEDVTLSGGHHDGVVEDDVQRLGHRSVAQASRRSSSASSMSCSLAVGS
jgi:hypothetical protein